MEDPRDFLAEALRIAQRNQEHTMLRPQYEHIDALYRQLQRATFLVEVRQMEAGIPDELMCLVEKVGVA